MVSSLIMYRHFFLLLMYKQCAIATTYLVYILSWALQVDQRGFKMCGR